MYGGRSDRMRIQLPFQREEEVIARFGQATLVRTPQGKVELRGGTDSDHTEAREWISMFMHSAVPRVKPWRRTC